MIKLKHLWRKTRSLCIVLVLCNETFDYCIAFLILRWLTWIKIEKIPVGDGWKRKIILISALRLIT